MAEQGSEQNQEKAPQMGKLRFIDQFNSNLVDTIAYIILAFGLLYCFFDAFKAGILVGTILGVYFSEDIVQNAQKFKDTLIRDGIFKGFTLLSAMCAFTITAPGMVVGLFLGTLVRQVYGIVFPKPAAR